jgi:hypothetical protein
MATKTALRIILLLVASMGLHAQTLAQDHIALGQSIVTLNGPWKFHIGDNPRWADPGFDDSQWETVDFAAEPGSVDPATGVAGYSPGWTAKGHPGYSGYAWYRIRLQFVNPEQALAMLVPSNIQDAYQVFSNGRLVGSMGKFDRPVPTIDNSQARMIPLPPSGGTMVLTLRLYMAPLQLLFSPGSGGMHSPPLLGLPSAVVPVWRVAQDDIFRGASSDLLAALLFLAFAFLVLILFLFDRSETILLWPLSACLFTAAWYGLSFLISTTNAMTALQGEMLGILLGGILYSLWLVTWWAYLGLQRFRWIRNAIAVWVIAALTLELPLMARLYGPNTGPVAFQLLSAAFDLALGTSVLLLLLIVFLGWRHRTRDTWLALLAIFFHNFHLLEAGLRRLHIFPSWFPAGIRVDLPLIGECCMLVCFSFLLLRHFRSSQRRQQAMVEDVLQAQAVQQVLIPEALPHIPGLRIESEYRPAREVGGDFFQILPHPTDGSVLIVAGDVTGKGLQAGMLVALIVGAIRTAAHYDPDPLAVLQELNQRLCGRGSAHATCLALRIAADGGGRLANAGHLPPYLNGEELPMEGALPLGMVTSAEFSVMHFQLHPGDTLLLVSDGVAEAQNEHGQLFGFERIHALLQRTVTAAELASAAQSFGQEDDISVVSVTRTAKQPQETKLQFEASR